MFSKALLTTALISAVSAHQNWHQLWINDVTPGYQVGIRMPPSNSPVTDLTSKDIACNVGGSKVPSGVETVAANEGDTIKVQWDQSGHPGPITHMLFGPVDDASQATGVGAGWLKIDELSSANGVWGSAIMAAANMTHTFKLPTGLASGEYLLRSEMLALHGAQTLGGGQFYIGCGQLKITGTGSKGTCGPTIELPGAYHENDADIYIPNFYNGFDNSNYTAPGGPVASCSGSGASVPAVSAVPKPASSIVAATPVATPSKSAVASVIATPIATPSAVVESPTTPSAIASPVVSVIPSTGAGGGESSGSLPAKFTLETFITWLEGMAASSSAKVRRHARAF